MRKHKPIKEKPPEKSRVFSAAEILAYIKTQEPMTPFEVDKYSVRPGIYEPAYNRMNPYEARLARFLISKGLSVYREIPLSTNGANADFYIFNPKSGKGKLVEVTLIYDNHPQGMKLPSRKTRARKKRQLRVLEKTSIPFVILHKEQLTNIRRFQIKDLF